MACGLVWTVPPQWGSIPREKLIARIRKALHAEMGGPLVDAGPYRRMLDVLARRNAAGWRHRLMTTNWDTLLDREMNNVYPTDCPPWLESSHVFHINGTVEEPSDNPRRSFFILESDPVGTRVPKLESNLAITSMTWSDCFVVVGMSFECAMDNSLLAALGQAQLPVEGSHWIVLNPDGSALDTVCANIQYRLRNVTITRVPDGFAEWLGDGLPELQDLGVLNSESHA
jgi:hypothetical protein